MDSVSRGVGSELSYPLYRRRPRCPARMNDACRPATHQLVAQLLARERALLVLVERTAGCFYRGVNAFPGRPSGGRRPTLAQIWIGRQAASSKVGSPRPVIRERLVMAGCCRTQRLYRDGCVTGQRQAVPVHRSLSLRTQPRTGSPFAVVYMTEVQALNSA